MLVNGVSGNSISIRDRGLLYGDGVFRTFPVRGGKPSHWSLHYRKLQHDCDALGISCPDFGNLTAELDSLCALHRDAVLKIVVTRGQSARGYAPDPDAEPSRLWDVFPLPDYPGEPDKSGVTLALCSLRLGHQPLLAGIKHLNRLENVLAAAECKNAAEGLMLDGDDRVIEGTRSNLFLVIDGRLITPDLSRCGVAGVQRDRVIRCASDRGIPVEVRDVLLDELLSADALFLTSSVFGLWPVARFEGKIWTEFIHAGQMRAWLSEADHG